MERSIVKLCAGSVKEADFTGELEVWVEPVLSGDPQSAADLVELLPLGLQGSAVRRHALLPFFLVDQPEHADVIWVETGGQADQGLLAFAIAFFPELFRRRREQYDCGSCDDCIWFWTDV